MAAISLWSITIIMKFLFPLLATLFFSTAALADNYQRTFDAADKKDWSSMFSAAQATGQSYMEDYALWRKLRSRDNRGSADQILTFMENHKDWPEMDRLAQRAAEALLLEGYSSSDESRWRSLSGNRQELFGYGWVEGSYNNDEQKRVVAKYAKKLNRELYEARADRLLWNNEATRASVLLPNTRQSFRHIAEARIAYITRHGNAKRKLSKLSRKDQRHPALIFARVNYHKKKRQHRSAENLLKQLPSAVPHGKKWWKLWRYYAREAVGEKRYRDAYNILRPIKKAEHGTQAQLFWLRGWIQLQFLDNAKDAYKDFYTFHKHVGTPISKTRGAYWAGLAAKASNQGDIARNWFGEAAKYPMSFYGQMALLEQSRASSVRVSRDRLSSSSPRALRNQLPLIRKLAKYKQGYSLEAFLFNIAEKNNDDNAVMAVAETARKLGSPHLAVRIGKNHFGNEQEWLQAVSHPVPSLPKGLAVEPALVLAISRQESEFNPNAKSSANARGLMQLLPATASSTAKKHGIRHSTSMLSNPKHNMKLGSYYLAGLIEQFDGAYPLAMAGYNAGPGRVVQWKKKFGPWPSDTAGQLKWLEQIPFSETRNYVQRVTENLHVYRKLLGEKEPLTKHSMFGR